MRPPGTQHGFDVTTQTALLTWGTEERRERAPAAGYLARRSRVTCAVGASVPD
ncbi:hypothetical protein RR42_s2873 [Cupriavidus basilensis]|uniref:Uncharacterized protein n=1 Tax=Cupriavidus basilensis TaxID=68895 RepID=A0A0C4YR21_9BURK|nr:hypothetical protein RR42_s2873 [Cupriavidus basilensis]